MPNVERILRENLRLCKMPVSKTQIDKIGDRLKSGFDTDSDLHLLDDYRRSFTEAYRSVILTLVQIGEFPTGRPAKSTASIAEKLRRESIRLSQMQDIAGCRLVVKNIAKQEQFVESMRNVFPEASVVDRRSSPSYGYRAIHIIAEVSGKPVEIQIRTELQHLWAEVSEKSSDVLDSSIKYGGGPESWRNFLTASSESVATYEKSEEAHDEFERKFASMLDYDQPSHEAQELQRLLEESRANKERHLNFNAGLLNWAIAWLDERPKE